MSDEFEFTPAEKYWCCQECTYIDRKKPMPVNREVFYAAVERSGKSPKCPHCGSQSLMPVGF